MFGYYSSNAATLPERLGLLKIGEMLREEYPLDPRMPECLAALLAQLERSEQSAVLTLAESCLRAFDRLDEVIRRSVIALVTR
jgi:hypothetical protein